MKRVWFALGLSFPLALSACSSDSKDVVASTQLLLAVKLEPELPIDRLHAELWIDRPTGWELRSQVDIGVTANSFPVDIPIVASHKSDESLQLELVVEASQAGLRGAQTRVVTHFVSGQRARVEATLSRCLRPTPDLLCSDDTCHGASCAVCLGTACAPVGTQEPEQVASDVTDAAVGSLTDGGHTDAGSVGAVHPGPDSGATPADASTQPGSDAGVTDAQVGGATDAQADLPGVCPALDPCAAPYPCTATPRGYTCLGQFADWPMPDGTPGAKVGPSYFSDGTTAKDNVTGLEWQLGIPKVYSTCTGGGPDEPTGSLCSRIEGLAYCAALVQGGHDDWRLPSIIELTSLLASQKPARDIGIDEDIFGDTLRFVFVSNSFAAQSPSNSWILNYVTRETYVASGSIEQVRCVRAGKPPPFASPAERYQIDSASNSVTARATGLVWMQNIKSMSSELANAATLCDAGFRLPTTNELLTLVDPSRTKPAIDPTAFPGTPLADFWVSDQSIAVNSVDFATGTLKASSASSAYVRCVK